MSVVPPRRLALVVGAVAALVAAAPAASHPPTQHQSQLLPASALSTFNVDARMRSALSAECENGQAGPFPCKNVDLASFVALPALGGASGNDIWGWTDRETGHEYAIMGTSTSTAFVDVTDPENPALVGVLPTRGTPDLVLWRDVKVHKDHAFIVSEISRSGLQVFDLTRLRGQTSPTVFTDDAHYTEFSRAHNISINPESDTAYVVGGGGPLLGSRTGDSKKSNGCTSDKPGGGTADGESGGLHMVDISDPKKPTFLGCATVDGANWENNYAHDVECVNYAGPDTEHHGKEICFGSNEDAVVVYDVTDKGNPKVLSSTTYKGAAYTHQGSLTEDQRYFLFGDELDEQENGQTTTTYILDAQDLDSPVTPVAYAHPSKSIDHNMYVHGDRVYQSNYAEGLRILEWDGAPLDADRNPALEEVGFFDVLPGVDVAEFAGTWSNYRFPESGTTVVSTIENEVNGMFVLRPQLDRGTRGRGEERGRAGAKRPEHARGRGRS